MPTMPSHLPPLPIPLCSGKGACAQVCEVLSGVVFYHYNGRGTIITTLVATLYVIL